ncbi:MAG: gliding motility-associated C-terminal domain-containing protein [Bacteroidia bacterium]
MIIFYILFFLLTASLAVKSIGFKFAVSKVALILTLITSPVVLNAQLSLNVINQGLSIKNTNDSVIIFGNVIHNGVGSTQDGLIENDGNFYISGDWTNNNVSGGIFATNHNGWVHLDSALQTINGTTLTHFNNLNLVGQDTSKKLLVGVDAEVEDTLALNSIEFDIADNTVHVLSTDTAVVTRTIGFVSSIDDGGLARNTANEQIYFFPVGSSIGTTRFRPVEIKPATADPNTYKVRMANNDATDDGFDITTKEAIVGDINPYYYHKVTRLSGETNIDLTIYYDDTLDTDGVDFDIIAYWEDLSEWKNPDLATALPGNYGLPKALRKEGFDKFITTSSTPVALSRNVDIAGEIFVANVFSPNGDGFNDFVFARGKALTEIEFIIYDRWGQKVFETKDITVGWDGRSPKGEPLNTAVFVYVVKGKFKNGDEATQKGNITLLR